MSRSTTTLTNWVAEACANPSPAAIATAAAAVTAAVFLSVRSFLRRLNDASDYSRRVRLLKRLICSGRSKLGAFDVEADRMCSKDLLPLEDEVEKSLGAKANLKASEQNLLIRRLRYLEEGAQRLLESLDNVKPNGILLEYTHVQPLPPSPVPVDDDEGDMEPQEQLQAEILATFDLKERRILKRQIDGLKMKRKHLVKKVLNLLQRVDLLIDRLQGSC